MIPEPASYDPDAGADAIRDAFALLRAGQAEDSKGIDAVADNMQSPRTVALILAGMVGALMEDMGMDIDYLARWQEAAGL